MQHKDESAIGVIFSEDKSQVLLIQRRDVPVWVLPGGGIDTKESPSVATVREVLEETGLKVNITRKVGIYYPINRLSRISHLFECQILSGQLLTGDETRNIAFFPIHHLPKLLPPPYDMWIQDALSKKQELIQKKLVQITYRNLLKNVFKHPLLGFRFLLSKVGKPYNS